ncbi:MAG TPA: hypothetical protein DCZ10_15990 [Pelotomaculum sp.]|nr:hypothetical protein [Pelotomaculum sp.]
MGKDDVNARLYDFLKDNETGLYSRRNEIIAYVHINFYDLKEFIEIVGDYYFDEGGIQVQMLKYSICVDINDIIEGEGHYLSAYKNCFDEQDWKYCEEQIKAMEVIPNAG